MLKQAWLESGGVYDYRKLTLDMRDLGERCGKHRVARLLKADGLRSQTGYGRRPDLFSRQVVGWSMASLSTLAWSLMRC
ncbi:hypothetical protein Cthiooxydans_17810 [Comamonas thiooxydans]|nr:hypothetical protein Cthiooxydans_17810 [Comamonas thiooxydans]